LLRGLHYLPLQSSLEHAQEELHLPSSPVSLDFEFGGKLLIDEGIFERAVELQLVTTEGAIPHR